MSLKEELDFLPTDVLEAFMEHGETAIYHAGEWLPNETSGFKGMRLIEDGNVTVYAIEESGKTRLCQSGKDEFLGVRSMFSEDTLPVIAWRAEGDVSCIEFKSKDVFPLLQGAEGFELRQVLERIARERDYDVLMTLHSLFRCLPKKERKNILSKAHPIALLPNEKLLQKNIENDTLYLISRGRVEVRKDGQLIASQVTGDMIGEISVLKKVEAATADVIAQGWCEMLAFPGPLIRSYCEAYADFKREFLHLQR